MRCHKPPDPFSVITRHTACQRSNTIELSKCDTRSVWLLTDYTMFLFAFASRPMSSNSCRKRKTKWEFCYSFSFIIQKRFIFRKKLFTFCIHMMHVDLVHVRTCVPLLGQAAWCGSLEHLNIRIRKSIKIAKCNVTHMQCYTIVKLHKL